MATPSSWPRRLGCGLLLCGGIFASTVAAADNLEIRWEVANRFRLFADQADFDAQVKAAQDTPQASILKIEQKLAEASGGRGWAANLGDRLCFDSWRGRILEDCKRDGTTEKYLNALDARVSLTAQIPANFGPATCTWTVRTGTKVATEETDCGKPSQRLRASTRQPSAVSVIARGSAGATLQGTTSIQVRDVFVVGMGDSIASGEGNPTKPVLLSDHGFCFRRPLSAATRQFHLPGRANLPIDASCQASDIVNDREIWDRAAASWLYNPCHRSIYSYQMRTALALAVENPQLIVTFLPLGCSGATIAEGLLGPQPARERPKKGNTPAPADVEAQISQLRNYLPKVGSPARDRRPDVILLTIGANDIGFSGLVANVMIAGEPERKLAAGEFVTPGDARDEIDESLRGDFHSLRRELARITGGNLDRVVFTTYGNPALFDGKSCPTSKHGFDSHPAFGIDGARLRDVVKFVDDEFTPVLKSLATCSTGGGCTDAAKQRMTYVDGHLAVFADHGFCATAESDPPFDKECFLDGGSFKPLAEGLADPMTCTRRPGAFQPYAKRARWIRTANDSYFAAMTYPVGRGMFSNPSDIHDGRWGLLSVVYGGAIHPTAEGHAAMADAALVAARKLLGLPASGAMASR